MTQPVFQHFSDSSQWLAVASGQAELRLSEEAGALRLDFDFHGGGGFVVARRLLRLSMPEAFLVDLRVRGDCLPNHFELKFEDPARRNVWRWTKKDFIFPHEPLMLRIPHHDIDFGWGPQGGGAVGEVGALEFAIVAGAGGRGTVWISDFEIEDRTLRVKPKVIASGAFPQHEASYILDADAASSWRSALGDMRPSLEVDFQGERELGGLVIRWADEHAPKGFTVELSADGQKWEAVHRSGASCGRMTYVRLQDRTARGLRLQFDELQKNEQVGVNSIEVKPPAFGQTPADFMHAVAADVPRGWFPRYWRREQSFWTPLTTPQGRPSVLINEEGLIEVDDGAFSLEPFIYANKRLITWADAKTEATLEDHALPLPSVTWAFDEMKLRVSPCVAGKPSKTMLHVRYSVTNTSGTAKSLRFLVMLRPFQVTPPWQSFREFGGLSAIRQVRLDDAAVLVNASKELQWSRTPSAFGALPFSEGITVDQLAVGQIPNAENAEDADGLASAVLAWDLIIPPNGSEVIELSLPLGKVRRRKTRASSADIFKSAARTWRTALGTWEVQVPEAMRDLMSTWKTAVAHILINRDGAALQPGSRRYTRCWIRDAAGMSAALLRAGHHEEVAELLRWYAPFQRADGLIPCCVDREGPDWLAEYDSLGQFIFILHEHCRFTQSAELVKELWPVVVRAVSCLEQLRKTRLTLEYRAPDKKARFGLMPESVSHEGYLAHPVHAYWDDFWDLRGLRDAVALSRVMDDSAQTARLQSLSQDFERTLGESLLATMKERGLDYVPGSVEWADFDPTATSNAIALLDVLPEVSVDLLKSTYAKYLAGFRDRSAGRVDWANYTPYEIRIITALVRLDQREDALELLHYFLAARCPLAWNQWPEIVWHDLRSPGHIGDVPHTWISAEYAQAARSLFVYEHDSDQSLVLAAGLPLEWLDGPGIRVVKLPTPYGRLSYTLRRSGPDKLTLHLLSGLQIPPGGVVIKAPALGPVTSVTVNAKTLPLSSDGRIVIRECPARIVISSAEVKVSKNSILPTTLDPAIHTLSNGRYTMRITERGTGQSTCHGLALNRWSGDLLEDHQGFFIYLRDAQSGAVWSATPFPVQHPAALHEMQVAPDAVSWRCKCDGIVSDLAVRLSAKEDFEVRTLTLRNESLSARQIEITSFLEVVLHDPRADAGHPAFLKLFVQTEHEPSENALLAHRRPRANDEHWPWMIHALAGAPVQAWETDRARFIGRGRSSATPAAVMREACLSQTEGNVLDPAFSLRTVINLPAGGSVALQFLLGMAPDRDAALSMVRRWKDGVAAPDASLFAAAHSSPRSESEARAEAPSELRLFNGYGGFSADGTEYVIKMPHVRGGPLRPPMPWINVLGHTHFGLFVSESGAACTWSRNSQANRLTPWSNDPITDPHGEALFIRDDASGEFWSPLPGPLPAPCDFEVRHGFGRSCFKSRWNDLEHDLTFLVPMDEPVRLIQWRLKNHSSRARRLSLFSFEQLILGTLPPAPHSIVTICDSDSASLRARHPKASEFAGSLVFASATVNGAMPRNWSGTCDRREFIGTTGTGIKRPEALLKTQSLSGSDGALADPCFAQQLTMELAAGEEVECVFMLGESPNEKVLTTLLSKYHQSHAVEKAFHEVATFWQEKLRAIQVETPMPEVDLMVNGWLAYQSLVCRMWGRTAFYQSSGAYGFRDQMQDASALLMLSPEITREQLLLHARQQFLEGDVLHWWHPAPIDRGLRTRFSDDLLWLPHAACRYAACTGDHAVLNESIPYITAPPLADGEDESYLKSTQTAVEGTLYEHCCRMLDRSLTAGAHGLPLMGTGDWNDGMNRVGRLGKGESVWLGFFLYQILGQFAPVCITRGDGERAERYLSYRTSLLSALNDAGWDGAWYRRAYYDNGKPLGTSSDTECRIDGLAQSWSVISKAAPADRAAQAMDSAAAHLIDEERGIIRLLTPPFVNTPEDPGYIKGYVAGVRENGGQYTHAACWVVKAMAELGRRNEAAHLLQRLSPVWHARDRESVERYKVEPYVIAADIYGEAPHVGRGGWTWYTGSAGWMFRVAVESVLGLSLEEGKWLVLKPCVPDSWPEYRLTYRHGKRARYVIHITNPTGSTSAVQAATLDGKPMNITHGTVRIPLSEDEGDHHVSVTLG